MRAQAYTFFILLDIQLPHRNMGVEVGGIHTIKQNTIKGIFLI